MRQTIEWMANESLPVFVKELPNVFCIYNKSNTANYAIVTLINLSSDTFNSFSLDVAPEWDGKNIEFLNEEGTWEKTRCKKLKSSYKIDLQLDIMKPAILKICD